MSSRPRKPGAHLQREIEARARIELNSRQRSLMRKRCVRLRRYRSLPMAIGDAMKEWSVSVLVARTPLTREDLFLYAPISN
jgi:hypothetical protein